jgi:group I intron endonuclease
MIINIYEQPSVEPVPYGVLEPMAYEGREHLGEQRGGIYRIICKPTGKVYVGSTSHIRKRKWEHRRGLLKQCHHNQHLQHAWNKYGKDGFAFSVLEYCPNDSLVEREQFYINLFNSDDNRFGFNIYPPTGTPLGYKHTEETRAKMSASKAGNTNTLGHHLTEEHKAKISKMSKGNTYCLGYKHTEEAKKNMAAGQLGRKHPPEIIQKIKDSNTGKIRSLATRNNISKVKTKFSEEQCEEIRSERVSGATASSLAEKHKCCIETIFRICMRSRRPYR